MKLRGFGTDSLEGRGSKIPKSKQTSYVHDPRAGEEFSWVGKKSRPTDTSAAHSEEGQTGLADLGAEGLMPSQESAVNRGNEP